MSESSKHVAVIGAGIVGVSCAIWLQSKGHRVSLIDGNEPGSITSSGNACTIADYGCVPVNSPSLFKKLPSLLFSRNSPLSINPLYTIRHFPWMWDFLRNCREKEVGHTIQALGKLLKHTYAGLDPLIAMTGTDDLFVTNGCMYVYESENEFNQAKASNQSRADQGNEFSTLSKDDVYDLEPNLKPIFEKGIIFRNARQVVNPKTLVTRFFQCFIDNGGKFVSEHAHSVVPAQDGVSISLASNNTLSANSTVITAGAFSRSIKGSGAENLPLDTERGYHIQYAGLEGLVNRPVAWANSGFYATPTNEGLRFAGTVEIAGLSEKKNAGNIDFLERKSRQMFEIQQAPSSDWLGFRPTMPDALPVIGPSNTSPNTFYAFGHQHIGLTLAGITGKLIAELVSNETPSADISAFSPARFSR